MILVAQKDTNIMAGPGEEYLTPTVISKGTAVKYMNQYGDWYLVQNNKGKYFWLSVKDLKRV